MSTTDLPQAAGMTDRDATIRIIRSELKRRSGKPWSVKGGRGTAWGWITVTAPPARAIDRWGTMGPDDAEELGRLMGLDGPAHCQGLSIAASSDYRQEYVDRARGRTPSSIAQPYWD